MGALEGGEPDPHRIAEDLIARMDLADVRAALAETLPAYVAKRIHLRRNMPGRAQAPASARWKNVAELQASGELSLLRSRVFAAGAWKFLGDCTRDEIQDLSEARAVAAAQNAAAARRFEALGEAMRRRKADVVSDLPPAVLEEIFNA